MNSRQINLPATNAATTNACILASIIQTHDSGHSKPRAYMASLYPRQRSTHAPTLQASRARTHGSLDDLVSCVREPHTPSHERVSILLSRDVLLHALNRQRLYL